MKICPNCSARNYDNAEVCFNCGTPLANAPVYPDPMSQQQPGMNPYTQMPYQQNPYNMQFPGQIPVNNMAQPQPESQKPKKNKSLKKDKRLIIFCAIAGVLLITNIITLILLLNSQDMKYKNAYLTLQKTVMVNALQESFRSAFSGGNSDSGSALSKSGDPTATPEPKEPLPLELKQRFDLQDVDIQLDSVQWGDEVVFPDGGKYSDKDGEKYFYIFGTVKNNMGESINLDYSLKASFIFNDKYKYNAWVSGDDGDSIKPLASKVFLIYYSVPDEVKDIFDNCLVTIGYNDDFSTVRYDDFEEMDKVYQLYVR